MCNVVFLSFGMTDRSLQAAGSVLIQGMGLNGGGIAKFLVLHHAPLTHIADVETWVQPFE